MNPDKQKEEIALWLGAEIRPNHDMDGRDENRYFECIYCGIIQSWRERCKDGELKGRCVADKNDYLNDLNAMHEAENKLTEDQYGDYLSMIEFVLGIDRKSERTRRIDTVRAIASERAEALLRTINKWI